MSEDYEALEMNQPKINYLKPENNTKCFIELINKTEEIPPKLLSYEIILNKKKTLKGLGDGDFYHGKLT